MRFTLTLLFMLMSLAPALQAQTEGFSALFRAGAGLRGRAADRLRQPCSQPQRRQRYVAGEDPGHLQKRKSPGASSFGTTLPRCAEAIDIAVLMSHNTSDLGGMAALTYAGISLSLNRYKDRLWFEGNKSRPSRGQVR